MLREKMILAFHPGSDPSGSWTKRVDESEGGSILKRNKGVLFLALSVIICASIGGAQQKKETASLVFTNVRLIDGTGAAPGPIP